ncbi:MAG: TIR domain-containing protein [Clostridia bacterium]|nr:TIR domain-containing protein [Clostridia bacterium]
MAFLKCKMCGGDLDVSEGSVVAECEYCGTKQTVPRSADENLQNVYNRANILRIKGEFDKAERLYEKIIQADSTEAEAYFGMILCRYGIEYVDDPATLKKVPTCHRASYDSIVADEDYKSALRYADSEQRAIYEKEAREIDRIQKEILALAQREESYDIFICYKETGADGERTHDSVIANDIYYQLTREGYKVFYAAITLEGKLGSAYEPIIFAALNSAKVMLAIGTRPEYFNAVWVKNEWSRYLKIIKKDRTKLLIPCYRDMDAYELPEEFAHLQAQNMAKIGFMNDIIHGVGKVLKKDAPAPVTVIKETTVSESDLSIAPLLKRAFMFLEDGDWDSADEYCEKVLDRDPENAEAYLGKLMAELRVKTRDSLKDCRNPFDTYNNYKKTIRFADAKLKSELEGVVEYIKQRNEEERLEGIYQEADEMMTSATSMNHFKKAAEMFANAGKYKDAEKRSKECLEFAEIKRKDNVLAEAISTASWDSIRGYEKAIKLLDEIPGWRKSDEYKKKFTERHSELLTISEEKRLEKERQAELIRKIAAKRAKRLKIIKAIAVLGIALLIAFVILWNNVISPIIKYSNAVSLMEDGKYYEAIAAFEKLDGYKDSADKIDECNISIIDGKYKNAVSLMEAGKYAEAIELFSTLSDYKDSKKYLTELIEPFIKNNSISVGDSHTIGLKADGSVIAVGANGSDQCNVDGWSDIVAISAGGYHTVGLKADGSVVSVGNNGSDQCDVDNWSGIVAISAGGYHTVGLKADGSVVSVGSNGSNRCDVDDWSDIVAISAGGSHTVGLKADGSVITTGANGYDQCNVDDWTDIVAISAGDNHTVGLKADGSVVAVGYNYFGQCDVDGWSDIVAISAGSSHTVGLKADGTVVAVGANNNDRCGVDDWTDIVAISAGCYHTVGLKADGTVVAVGSNSSEQCDVDDWTDIRVPKK